MSLQAASKAAALPKALANLIPASTSAQLANKPRNLYETLSRLPKDGVGARVHQTRWTSKLIDGCFWEVTRVKLKCEGSHGKAWGKLVWRGTLLVSFIDFNMCFPACLFVRLLFPIGVFFLTGNLI